MARVLEVINGIPRGREEAAGSSVTIYDESVTVGAGGISTGTPISLPSAKTYDSAELQIFLNGQYLDNVLDYNYVGVVPRTQISMTFDLVETDELRFRIDRAA